MRNTYPSRSGLPARRLVLGLGAVGLPLLAAACSQSKDSKDSGSSSAQQAATADPTAVQTTTAGQWTSRDDLINPQPLAWDTWRAIDDTTIELGFSGGSSTCMGVHVDVGESPDAVDINLTEGTIPGAPAECPAILEIATVRVTLASALGSRTVSQSNFYGQGTQAADAG
ncbi:hypothetical protein [Actinomyces timonensis]|uniref:hypothetical protein n=1 Tax=Actinomyces timonensis TaxID=1288391 RepID=UPI00030A7FCF|nr:hypothetical protein [Actinomyces timonensis]